VFRPALTRPGYANALVVFVGWVLSSGPHAVTEALVVTDVARRRHHERFHRFFSRGAWSPDEIGRLLFQRILTFVAGEGPIHVVLDDTLAAKKGPHVFGIGSHLDAVRSTKRFRVFCFGHVWVVLSVVVRLPFSRRPWALPVLFRLYRNQKECIAKGDVYRKKTELGRELVDVVAGWAGARQIALAADGAYCNDTLMRGLVPTVTVFGAMRPDAVLTALPTEKEKRATGRRRVRGKVLPKPEKLARNDRHPWQSCKADLYGRVRTVWFKTIEAQWYRACGKGLVRVVIVRCDSGAIPFRVFVCTDPSIAVRAVLETYAGRWAIEVSFRDLKQQLGFADSAARKRAAVERMAPFVGYIYTTLVLWFAQSAWKTDFAAPPIRPWYRHKRNFSFADILRAAQRALAPLDVLDPARSLDNLRQPQRAPSRSSPRRRGRGAAPAPTAFRPAA
jgi:DDE superfamily endonuclease